MKTPDRVNELWLECTCVSISFWTWEKLMKGAKRADCYKINRLVKKHLPDLFHDLALNFKPLKDLYWFNPYHYYKTREHLILVHSGIEYFLRYN